MIFLLFQVSYISIYDFYSIFLHSQSKINDHIYISYDCNLSLFQLNFYSLYMLLSVQAIKRLHLIYIRTIPYFCFLNTFYKSWKLLNFHKKLSFLWLFSLFKRAVSWKHNQDFQNISLLSFFDNLGHNIWSVPDRSIFIQYEWEGTWYKIYVCI